VKIVTGTALFFLTNHQAGRRPLWRNRKYFLLQLPNIASN
jgi:hypothetical protein